MGFSEKVRLHLKLPTHDNSKKKFPNEYYIKIEEEFIEKYGDYTKILPPSKGQWKSKKGDVYLDTTISYEIFIDAGFFTNEVEPQLDEFIEKLKKKFEQEEISCYYHTIKST